MNLTKLTEQVTAIQFTDPGFDTEMILARDEAGSPNQSAQAHYDRLGVAGALGEVENHGVLSHMPELMRLLREVCRKDLSTGADHILTTFIAGINVWVAGSAEQKERLAGWMRDGRRVAIACRGLDHADDPLADGLTATRVPGGYVLTGLKPLVSNVARGAAVVLQARTAEELGERSHSLFLIELNELDATRYEILPRVRTQGIRGCQIAGIRFQDCFIPEHCVLGEEGAASTHALKALQISQALVPGASLGNIESAIDVMVRYAGKRNLYGATVLDLPHARTLLTEAALEVYLADSLCRAAAGALHVVPGEMSALSAVCEFLVSQRMRAVLKRLALLLGSRYYLREGEAAPFEKILRDYWSVGLMHGNGLACQATIAALLPRIFRGFSRRDAGQAGLVKQIFQNDGLPPLEISRLCVEGQGADIVLLGLHDWPGVLRELCGAGRLDDTSCQRLCSLITDLGARVERLADEPIDARSETSLDVVRQYAWIECASAAAGRWIYERDGTFAEEPGFLGACLEFVLCQLDGAPYYPDITLATRIIAHLQHRADVTAATPLAHTHPTENDHVENLQ